MWSALQGTRTGCDADSTAAKAPGLCDLIGMANASPFLHLSPRQMDLAFSCQTVTALA
jgi:hypothetical protein